MVWGSAGVVAIGVAVAVLWQVIAAAPLAGAGGETAAPPPTVPPTTTTPSTTTPSTTGTGPGGGDGEADRNELASDVLLALEDADVADPFVVVDDRQAVLFTTNSTAGNVPVISADAAGDLVVSDALPVLPEWAEPGATWAPAVTDTGSGWVLAFSARDRESDRQCIGVATSSTVHGPYEPAASPLVCDLDRGGSIDPSFVEDDTGQRWLLYKDDGNCCGLPTALRSVPLTADATAVAGPATTLLTADQDWEGDLVEAPTMTRVGDRWLLLYSANRWDSADYAVGAAWCDTPSGPCTKQSEPVLTSGGGIDGPGGLELVTGLPVDGVAATFHAWPEGGVGDDGSTRRLHLGRIETTSGGTVSIVPLPLDGTRPETEAPGPDSADAQEIIG